VTVAPSFILVLNSGSSSLKFALFKGDRCLGQGAIIGIGHQPTISVKGELFADKELRLPTFAIDCRTTTDATRILINWLEQYLPPASLAAVGHRVVHGGDLTEAKLVTAELLSLLESLAPLAPLHQPFNLEAIVLIAKLYPEMPQIACFDTLFHNSIPPLHRRFALPREWYDKGVRRYGFHGMSYEYIAERLAELSPKISKGRTIAAHLGSGASLCALKGGVSFDVSTGFSALDGLIMGTRPGTLDAGVILYFLQEAGLDATAICQMLYHESGLLGISGISSDMATLLASPQATAREAIDLFCLRITREAGGLISLLGGMDVLVFTGGIGEHAPEIRAQICAALKWIGVDLDGDKNAAAKGDQDVLLSSPESKVEIWLIPTNEEVIIERHTRQIFSVLPNYFSTSI
jgi:acetate kinase